MSFFNQTEEFNMLRFVETVIATSPAIMRSNTDNKHGLYGISEYNIGAYFGAEGAEVFSEIMKFKNNGGENPASNYFIVENSMLGGALKIYSAGADGNIDIEINSKGAGKVKVNGSEVITSSTAQSLNEKTLSDPTLTGTIHMDHYESRTETLPSFSAVANAKVKLNIPKADNLGEMKITLSGGWSAGNCVGLLTKTITAYLRASGAIDFQRSSYTNVEGEVGQNFAISDIAYNGTTGLFEIVISKLVTGTAATLHVTIEMNGQIISGLDLITFGTVYTTDASIPAKPVLQSKGIEIATVNSSVKGLSFIDDRSVNRLPQWYLDNSKTGKTFYLCSGSSVGLPDVGIYHLTVDLPFSDLTMGITRRAVLAKRTLNAKLAGIEYVQYAIGADWSSWRRADKGDNGHLCYADDLYHATYFPGGIEKGSTASLSADSVASVGKAITAAVDPSVQRLLAATYPDHLKSGRYSACARVKTTNTAVTALSAVFSKKIAGNWTEVLTKTLPVNTITSNNVYQMVYFDFDWSSVDAGNQLKIEIRLSANGTTATVSLDYIEIVPTTIGIFE